MIGLASLVFDIDGSIVFANVSSDSSLSDVSRRISKSSLLDGGTYIQDNGFTHSDRTFTIVIKRIKKEHADKLKRLVESYKLLTLSLSEGVFEVAPESFSQSNDEARIQLLSNRILT